jgi:hypothetical protein
VASVIVPMAPPSECGQNSDANRWQRAKAVRSFRGASKLAAVSERPRHPIPTPARVEAVIGWSRGRQRMDRSNAAAALKPLVDGLVDAYWFDDDRDVAVDVVEQRTWGALSEGDKALYPGGFVSVTVIHGPQVYPESTQD